MGGVASAGGVMKKTKWELIVRGEVQDGFSVNEVKSSFLRLSRLPPERVDALFRERKALRKRNLDENQARLQAEILRRKGLVCNLRRVGDAENAAPTVVKSGIRQPVSPKAAAPQSKMSSSVQGRRQLRFSFLFWGTTREFFPIGIVNLLLTIVTAGLYLPWARVKTLRYLYTKTHLDGNSFSFLGQPLELLKICLIPMVILMSTLLVAWFHLPSGALLLGLLALLFPWFKLRLLRFEAENSFFRDIPFEFTGDVRGAYVAYLLWPVLVLLSAGLLYPQMVYQQKRYFFGGLRFGKFPFRFALKAAILWRLHLLAIGFIAAAVSIAQLIVMVAPKLVFPWIGLCMVLIGAFVSVRQSNAVLSAVSVAQYRLQRRFTVASWLWLQLSNIAVALFSLGLLLPWARIRAVQYRLRHTSLVGKPEQLASRRSRCPATCEKELAPVAD